MVHARTAGLGGWDVRRLKGRRRPPARWKTDAETLKNVQGGAGGRNAPAFGKYIGLELYPPQHPLKLVSVTERQPPTLSLPALRWGSPATLTYFTCACAVRAQNLC